MTDSVILDLAQVRSLTSDALAACGLPPGHVNAITDTIAAAERDGARSHGLFRIPSYVAGVRSGRVNPDAEPSVNYLTPSILRVDAQGGFAPLALEVGIDALTSSAREHGLAALALTRCVHLAALWYEVEKLATSGLVALAITTARAVVAPHGGTQPLFGTDPMAFGWPRPHGDPLVFDQASSASARGEIVLRQRAGEPIPDGWAIDAQGQPTTDPTAALAGAQLAFGGHKGASIALLVELLAGPLLGEPMSFQSTERYPDDAPLSIRGELIIAFHPPAFWPGADRDAQLRHAEELFARITAQEGARLPSDGRHAARARIQREGVIVPRDLYEQIAALAGH